MELSADDPIVLEYAERGIEPYRSFLPPEVLEELRRTLIFAMISHPYPQALIRQIRTPQVIESHVETTGGGPAHELQTARPKGVAGRGRKP
jgi:hypothetical protein